jgi:hypothetical protein
MNTIESWLEESEKKLFNALIDGFAVEFKREITKKNKKPILEVKQGVGYISKFCNLTIAISGSVNLDDDTIYAIGRELASAWFNDHAKKYL